MFKHCVHLYVNESVSVFGCFLNLTTTISTTFAIFNCRKLLKILQLKKEKKFF